MLDRTNLPKTAGHTSSMWKLVLAYDGTDFSGWQVQPGKKTVQGTLADVLWEITGERVLPQGSGRTDAGVHAEGQVASVALAAPIPPGRLQSALNRRLPASIRVLSAELAAQDFHARADVVLKTYEYRIFQRRTPAPLEEQPCPPWQARYVWDCRWPLDLGVLQHAAEHVVGTHDFTSFAAHDPDRARRLAVHDKELPANGSHTQDLPTNVRRIFSSSWHAVEDMLTYRVAGSGFLHHMVRNLVGTFVEIGAGKRDDMSVPAILQAKDRRVAGMTAPPQGLFLLRVEYRPHQTADAGRHSRSLIMAGQ